MAQWWNRFTQRRQVAHVLRAIERFNTRNGNQLSAAIAYFSVLSLVPVLMLVFSGIGMALTVFLPQALADLLTWIEEQFSDANLLGKQISAMIEGWLSGWATTLVFAIGIGFWAGSSWVGNLKRAVRLLMRSDVDRPGKQLIWPLEMLANFAGLIVMFAGIFATFAASSLATNFADSIGAALGVRPDGGGWLLVLRLVGLVVAFVAGTVLFWLLFTWCAPEPVPRAHLWVGSAVGSAGLFLLQLLSGYLIQMFSHNLGVSLFGATLVVMLFLNLFATLILFIAAWLATQTAPVLELEPAPTEAAQPPVETKPGQLYVSSKVAEQSLGIGLRTGYVAGAATGLGLGAILVGGLRALLGRGRK